MNRVKKISQLYADAKPEIDQQRAIRSHTRRARKAALHVTQTAAHLQTLRNALMQKNVKELKALAARVEIEGRSKMNKKQLVEAIITA